MPTTYELAALSAHIYDDDPKNLPDGWKRLSVLESDSGYRGGCYQKGTEIVFASRGTIKSTGDMWNDVKLLFEAIPGQSEEAAQFYYDCCEKLADMNVNISSITHTGHSLGAALASIVFSCTRDFNNSGCSAICFENPGTRHIIRNNLLSYGMEPREVKECLLFLDRRIKNYQADVNLINTCHDQIGETYRLVNKDYIYDDENLIPKMPCALQVLANTYYLYVYSKNEHSIVNMCEYIKNGGEVKRVNQPATIFAGYKVYLDGVTRKRYWDGYFLNIWNKDDSKRSEYKNDISSFMQDQYKILAFIRGKKATFLKFFDQEQQQELANHFALDRPLQH